MMAETTISMASLVIAALGLIFSVIVYIRDSRIKERSDEQESQLNSLQAELAKLQLSREKEAERKKRESKVEVHHVPIGAKQHRLRIANTGGVTVTNVTCDFAGGERPYHLAQDVEPFERLEPGDHFDDPMFLADGSPRKFRIITRWTDPEGNACERENIVAL